MTDYTDPNSLADELDYHAEPFEDAAKKLGGLGPGHAKAASDLRAAAALLRRQGEALAALTDAIDRIHRPFDEEVEVWADIESEKALHDQHFPGCPGGDPCEGHTVTIKVCNECGYDHDGDRLMLRQWPCPTARAAAAAAVASGAVERPTLDDTEERSDER